MGEEPPDDHGGGRARPQAREAHILDAVGDPVVRSILRATDSAARTAQEISGTTAVPLTTLYRKLHELQELDLVGVERAAITADGKRVDFYRSRLEELAVEMRNGQFSVRTRYRSLAAARLDDLWGQLRGERPP